MTNEKKQFQINTVHTEAKFMPDQIRAESAYDMDVKNFVQLEKKKFKKTDDLKDMIYRD